MEKARVPIKLFLELDDVRDRTIFIETFKKIRLVTSINTFRKKIKIADLLMDTKTSSADAIILGINEANTKYLKEIRKHKSFDHIPVIIFSNTSYIKDIDEIFALGANLFIAKPVFLKDSEKAIKTIFSPNWKRDLLKPDRKKNILNATTTFQIK